MEGEKSTLKAELLDAKYVNSRLEAQNIGEIEDVAKLMRTITILEEREDKREASHASKLRELSMTVETAQGAHEAGITCRLNEAHEMHVELIRKEMEQLAAVLKVRDAEIELINQNLTATTRQLHHQTHLVTCSVQEQVQQQIDYMTHSGCRKNCASK